MRKLIPILSKRIICGFILIFAFVLVKEVSAHKGSPWHGNGNSKALGLNSVYINVIDPSKPAKFRLRYPVKHNKLEYRVGDSSTVMVFPDTALSDDGVFTEDEVILAKEHESYSVDEPIDITFEVSKSGYHHIAFGPGKGTSILVLEPDLTFELTPIENGKLGKYFAPATSGDVHIINHPEKGLTSFAGWVAVMFEEYKKDYVKNSVALSALPPLIPLNANNLANKLKDRGYPQFSQIQFPINEKKMINAPFMGTMNGLGVQAFDAVFLQPGSYTYTYSPKSVGGTIIQSSEIVLQVAKDDSLDKGFGTEKDIIARKEFSSRGGKYSLDFKVDSSGYYHLMYGPGEGGMIFHLLNDESLPTRIEPIDGKVLDHVKLSGIHSLIFGDLGLKTLHLSQVFFPCKVVSEKVKPRKLVRGVTVPLTLSVAEQVNAKGVAIMHPIMVDHLRFQLRKQKETIKSLMP